MTNQRDVTKGAIKALGGQLALSEKLGISQQAVSQWVAKRGKGVIPVDHILHVERLLVAAGSEIDRYDLRPDVYGPRPDSQDASTDAA